MEGDGDVRVVAVGSPMGGAAAAASGEDKGFEHEYDVATAFCVVPFENAVTEGAWGATVKQLASRKDGLEASGGESPFSEEEVHVFQRNPLRGEFAVIVKEMAIVEPLREENPRGLEALGERF